MASKNDCAVYNLACCNFWGSFVTSVSQKRQRCSTAGIRNSGFPPCVNWLQATDYLLHVVRSRRDSDHTGYQVPQKYKQTKVIERGPGSGRLTKMTTIVKAFVERQLRGAKEGR